MGPDAGGSGASDGLYAQRWIALGGVVLASFVGTWDGTALVVALPAIMREYVVGVDVAVWVLTVGILFFAVPMAVFGKLGDSFGHRRLYLLSMAAFAAAAILAVIAPSLEWLIAARGLQGLSGAPAYTATMAFIADAFPDHERGRAMGVMGMAASLALAAGPVVGGALIEAFGWRSVILVEISFAMLAFLAAWKLVPKDPPPVRAGFDVAGATTFTAAALVFMFGLQMVGKERWDSGLPWLMVGLLASLMGAFLIIETRHPNPFLPLPLFRRPHFSLATAFSTVQMVANFALVLLVSLYLQEGLALGAAAAGLLIAGLPVARIFFDPLAGRLAELYGTRRPSLAGSGLLLIVALGFAFGLPSREAGWVVFLAMFIFGAGISLGRTPVNAAIVRIVSLKNLGLGIGIFSMISFMGSALGQTVFGVLLRTLSGAGNRPLGTVPGPDLRAAFGVSFAILAAIVLLVGALSLGLPGSKMLQSTSRRRQEAV